MVGMANINIFGTFTGVYKFWYNFWNRLSALKKNYYFSTRANQTKNTKTMKKSFSKLLAVVTVMLEFTFTAAAQFEGVIEFKKASTTDTTNYVYYVKGNQVRIDEIGSKSHKIEGSFLVDMDAKTMRFL